MELHRHLVFDSKPNVKIGPLNAGANESTGGLIHHLLVLNVHFHSSA
jgi:hypothetical protein